MDDDIEVIKKNYEIFLKEIERLKTKNRICAARPARNALLEIIKASKSLRFKITDRKKLLLARRKF